MSDRQTELAEEIAELLQAQGRSVAVAESLTSGRIATRLGAAPSAATWFRGCLVSYHDEVKHEVLDVDDGPVVTDSAARQMASGVARLLGADLAVATTGAGGPDGQDGQPPGTVFIGLHAGDDVQCREFHFEGEPPEVLDQTTEAALEMLRAALGDLGGGAPR